MLEKKISISNGLKLERFSETLTLICFHQSSNHGGPAWSSASCCWLIDGLFHAVFKNMELGIRWPVLNPCWDVWLGVVGSVDPAGSCFPICPERTLGDLQLLTSNAQKAAEKGPEESNTGHTPRKKFTPDICVTTGSWPAEVFQSSWGPFYLLEDTRSGGIGLLPTFPCEAFTACPFLRPCHHFSSLSASDFDKETKNCEMPLFTLKDLDNYNLRHKTGNFTDAFVSKNDYCISRITLNSRSLYIYACLCLHAWTRRPPNQLSWSQLPTFLSLLPLLFIFILPPTILCPPVPSHSLFIPSSLIYSSWFGRLTTFIIAENITWQWLQICQHLSITHTCPLCSQAQVWLHCETSGCCLIQKKTQSGSVR